MPEREEMLTPEEVADWLKVSYATALRLIKKGELPSVQVGRQYRVPVSEVTKLVKRQGGGEDD